MLLILLMVQEKRRMTLTFRPPVAPTMLRHDDMVGHGASWNYGPPHSKKRPKVT